MGSDREAEGTTPAAQSRQAVLLITDRLRGKYVLAVNDGAGLLNGSDTFKRQFETPPIQHEAATLIEELAEALKELHLKTVVGTDDERHAALTSAWTAICKATGQ